MEGTRVITAHIAKSEVLRVIDACIEEARRLADDRKIEPDYRYGWHCRYLALGGIRDIVANLDEQQCEIGNDERSR